MPVQTEPVISVKGPFLVKKYHLTLVIRSKKGTIIFDENVATRRCKVCNLLETWHSQSSKNDIVMLPHKLSPGYRIGLIIFKKSFVTFTVEVTMSVIFRRMQFCMKRPFSIPRML